MEENHPETITIYRLKSALSVSASSKKIFLSMAPFMRKDEKNNRTYDWKNKKVLIALNPVEVAAIIYHINNYYNKHYDSNKAVSTNPKSTGFYHQIGVKTAQLWFQRNKNPIEYPGYSISILNSINNNKSKESISISREEGELLKIIMEHWIFYAFSWNRIFTENNKENREN